VLEDRTVPATVSWSNPAGGDWSVASNWSTGTLPGPNDDVVIDSPISGATITRGSGSTDSIHSLTVHGNALTFANGSLSIAADSSTDSDFILSGGTLSLGGAFETAGNSQWRNATVQGAGSWVNDGNLAIGQGVGTTLHTVLRNNGSIVETGFLTLGAGGDLQNTAGGYYDFAADVSIFANGNGRFDNAGMLQKTGGAPNVGSSIQGGNVLGGTVDAEVGRLQFDSTGGALVNGTFIAAAGAFVDIGNLSLSPGSTLVNGFFTGHGDGAVSLIGNINVGQTGATFDFPGSTLIWGNATIDGGAAGFTNLGNMTQTSNVNHPLRGLFVNDGTLVQTGNANLQLGASAVLVNEAGAVYDIQGDTGGIFGPNGSANTGVFYNAGTLQKSGGTGNSLVNLALNNAGTVAVSSGTLTAEGTIAQLAGSILLGGTWDVSANASLLLTGPPITTNAATIQLSGPGANFVNLSGLTSNTGTVLLLNGQSLATHANLVNSGAIYIDAASALTVGQNYTQTGGLTELAGGTLATATIGNNVYLYGGLLSGFGTIGANVTNDGELNVELGGLGETGLTITGVYIQGGTGILDIAIGGYNAGTDYSVLQIGGFASLAGTLNVSLANGFVPTAGDSFDVLTAAQVAGNFATEQGLDLGNGLAFVPVLDATSLTLVTVAS
jgi:hypothetical protein